MIILGVDTAIRCTGYGVIKIENVDHLEIIDCGVIKNRQKDLHSECLRRIAGGIKELIKTYSPDVASIEGVFYQKNIKTAMVLSLARGAVIATLAEHKIPIFEYSPKSAKKAVVGTGSASKEQVATMLAAISNLNIANIPLDSTDAISLALCHGQIATRVGGESLLPKNI